VNHGTSVRKSLLIITLLVLQGSSLSVMISFSETATAGPLPLGTTAYHSYNETVDELNQIATDHPSITKLISIGKSYEGRDIWAMKVSDNPEIEEEDEPEVYFNGNHHAREWLTIEVCLYILNYLTDNYSTNLTIANIVNNRQIWVVPIVNPDGRVWDSEEDDPANHRNQPWGWRKNRMDNGDGSFGVDLNRNYGYMWGGAGASDNPSDSTYRGPEPFSENETKAIRDFVKEHNFVFSISYHTYGQLILYPWGYTYNATEDDALLEAVANGMADLITNKASSARPGYTPAQGADLYMTSGSDDDWLYGEMGIYAYCIELYPYYSDNDANVTAPYDKFHPSENKVLPVCEDNIEAALYLAKIADNPFQALNYHVSLYTDTESQLVNQTETEVTDITITNDGGLEDTYDLSASSIPGWTINLDKSTIYLNSESSGTVTLSVTVPGGESGGDYFIWVNATSQSDSTVIDTLLFTVTVPYFHDVGLQSIDTFMDGGTYPAGQYMINSTVKNYGRTTEPGFNVSLEIIHLGTSVTQTVFSDDMESGVNEWQVVDLDGSISPDSWKQTTSTFNSSTTSWWCGAAANYSNKTAQLLVSPSFDLTDATGANLTFYHKYNIEASYDYGSVDVYNGTHWITLGIYDGDSPSSFELVELSLSDFIDRNDVQFRFRFTTDEGVIDDGWFIDDVKVTAEFPTETIVYGPALNQTSGMMIQDDVQMISWDYTFTESGNYKIRTTTLLGTDEFNNNNQTYVNIKIVVKIIYAHIPVQIGWNLISTPLLPDNTSVPTVLQDLDGDTTWTNIWHFNSGDTLDNWKSWVEDRPSNFDDLQDIDNTMGVWLYIPDAISLGDGYLNLSGSLSWQVDIQLRSGWNLVGFPSKFDKPRDVALGNLIFGDDIYKIKWFNATAGKIEDVSISDNFRVGQGYWIYANKNCVWEVPL
jgi:hypothetical protein